MGNEVVSKTPSQFLATTAAKNMLANVFSNKQSQDNFVSSYLSAVAMDKNLLHCDPATTFTAFLKGASLGFSYGTGDYYVVSYQEKKDGIVVRNTCQFQMGYRGFVQLAKRSGVYSFVNVVLVRAGEYKGRDKFTAQPIVEFDEIEDLKKPVIGYLAFAVKKGESKPSEVLYWSKAQAEQHGRRYSKAYSKLWTSDFDAMAMKTVIKMLCDKQLVKSTELVMALQADQGIIKANGDIEYIDNPENDVVEADKPKRKTTVKNKLGDAEPAVEVEATVIDGKEDLGEVPAEDDNPF